MIATDSVSYFACSIVRPVIRSMDRRTNDLAPEIVVDKTGPSTNDSGCLTIASILCVYNTFVFQCCMTLPCLAYNVMPLNVGLCEMLHDGN